MSMTEEEIQKRVKEAEQFAEQDKKHRDEVETVNRADNLIYDLEKQLKDNADKLSSEDKATIETAIADFKKVRETNDADQIKSAMPCGLAVANIVADAICMMTKELLLLY